MIKEWLIESSSDFQCIQVTTHRHERYDDPLVSVSKFKYCQLSVITLDELKPAFDFRLIPAIRGRYYGIDIHGDGANNIRNIDVSLFVVTFVLWNLVNACRPVVTIFT